MNIFAELPFRLEDKSAVALESIECGTTYCAVAEGVIKLLLCHRHHLLASKVKQMFVGLELWYHRGVGETVVRATKLALVASHKTVTNHFGYPLWQFSMVLNGEARKASTRIDSAIEVYCSSGTIIYASTAVATRNIARLVGSDFERSENHAEEEKRAFAR